MNTKKVKYVECQCSSKEHAIRLTWYTDERPHEEELFLEYPISACDKTLWQRFKIACKYFLFGEYIWISSDTSISMKEANLLKSHLTEFIDDANNVLKHQTNKNGEHA